MCKRLEIGDPVTLHLTDFERRAFPKHARVVINTIQHASGPAFCTDRSVAVYTYADEGLSWARGHLAADSPAWQALIVARAIDGR